MKKFVLAAILSIVATYVADAQKTVFTESEMKAFTSVNVSDYFVVTMKESDDYILKTNIDERIDPYVAAYVKDGVLYLDVDRKKFPSELKKVLRAEHGQDPVIEAEVMAPVFKSLEVSGNAVVKGSDDIEVDSFRLTASDKAFISNVEVICKDAEVKISKSAEVDVEINASSGLDLQTAGTSKTFIKFDGDTLAVTSSGSSSIEAIVNAGGIVVENSGLSNVKVTSGNVQSLRVNASGSSKLDVAETAVPYAYMIQTGSSKSVVNVTDTLKVNLAGNSSLEFKNNPYIDLERIISSTLVRHSGTSLK